MQITVVCMKYYPKLPVTPASFIAKFCTGQLIAHIDYTEYQSKRILSGTGLQSVVDVSCASSSSLLSSQINVHMPVLNVVTDIALVDSFYASLF